MFYTYLWLREDGTPYYIGKGKERRAYSNAMHRQKPPEDSTRIIIQEWLSEEQAFEAERFLISFYGRKDLSTGCLRNLTDGGDGFSGGRHSQENKDAASQRMLGTHNALGCKRDSAFKEMVKRTSTGRVKSPETIEKLRQSALRQHKENPMSPETREKISAASKAQKNKRGPKGKLWSIARWESFRRSHA